MNCGQRAALLRLRSDVNNSGHLSLCLQQTSSPRSAKWSCKTSPFWLGCHEELREVRAPKARRWGWEGRRGEHLVFNYISTEAGGRRRIGDWSLMRGRQIQQVGGSHPLKFHEEPLANKTKARGSCRPPCLYPSIPPRDASFRKAVPFHLSPSSILSLVGFLYEHLFMISFSIFPFPCTSVTVWPSCPPLSLLLSRVPIPDTMGGN